MGFKISTDTEVYGSLMVHLAIQELGFKKLAVIFAQNDFANNMKKPMADVAASLGGELVFEEGFTPDTTDFRTILTNVQNSGAEALLLACYSQEGALIVNQAKELGLELSLIGDGVFMDKTFFEVVGENAEGLYAITGDNSVAALADFTTLPQYVQDFYSRFEEIYGELPETWEPAAYDAVYILAHAVDQVGNDRAAIIDYLETFDCMQMQTFECFSFGTMHWPVGDLNFFVWEDGMYKKIGDAPEADYLPER